MSTDTGPFGPAWAATMHNPDGLGLQHRPDPSVPPRPRRTARAIGELLRLTDQADALAHELRRRAVWASAYDPRLCAIAGRAHARLLRRIWLGRQPCWLAEEGR